MSHQRFLMGAQKAAAKPIQEISVSNLGAVTTVKWTRIFCFFFSYVLRSKLIFLDSLRILRVTHKRSYLGSSPDEPLRTLICISGWSLWCKIAYTVLFIWTKLNQLFFVSLKRIKKGQKWPKGANNIYPCNSRLGLEGEDDDPQVCCFLVKSVRGEKEVSWAFATGWLCTKGN